MFLAFCDEQDDSVRKYSAAVACVIEDRKVDAYRVQLISDMRRIFERDANTATPFPVLHAAELPEKLGDEAKAELFGAVIKSVKQHFQFVYRIGYGWEDPDTKGIFGLASQRQARAAAYTTMQHELPQLNFRPMAFVQEYDESSHEGFSDILNRTANIEQLVQLNLLGGEFGIR